MLLKSRDRTHVFVCLIFVHAHGQFVCLHCVLGTATLYIDRCVESGTLGRYAVPCKSRTYGFDTSGPKALRYDDNNLNLG